MRSFSLSQQWILWGLSFLILLLLYFKFFHPPFLPPEQKIQEIAVEIEGEIHRPGIYLFHHPPTLRELVQKAGGFKESIRFAEEPSSETLPSGTRITIKKRSPDEITINIGRMEAYKLLVFSLPLDLNRVSPEDLSLIPGIGESLSQEIIAYRQKRRGFRSVEELKEVKGIGEAKFQSIKKYLTVE